MRENKLVPNSVTYGCLIDACVKNNQIERALEVYRFMKHDKVTANTIICTTLIKGFSKAFRLEDALEMFETMRYNQDGPDDGNFEFLKPNNVTYNSIIDCCIRCNNLPKAQEIFTSMKQ